MSTTALDVHPARDPDEEQLITRARAGDEHAIDALVRRYLTDVYAVTQRVLNDVELAQDAAQETFLNALRGLAGFRGEASFRTWLLRIAVNSARTVARRHFQRREVPLEVVQDVVAIEIDTAQAVSTRLAAERIRVVLEQLPEKQRLAVTLRINQGLSYQEIGKILECTDGAARVNYHLGIKRLRELVQ